MAFVIFLRDVTEAGIKKPVGLVVGNDISNHYTVVSWLTAAAENIIFLPMTKCVTDIFEAMELGVLVHLVPKIRQSLKYR